YYYRARRRLLPECHNPACTVAACSGSRNRPGRACQADFGCTGCYRGLLGNNEHERNGKFPDRITPCGAWSETGKMWVAVQDAYEKPIAEVEIGIKGIGGSKLTGSDGKGQLALAKDTLENDWMVFQIVHSPPGKDLVIISPWDARAQVPSFKEKAENFVLLVLVERGDRAALTNPNVTRGLAERINEANAP